MKRIILGLVAAMAVTPCLAQTIQTGSVTNPGGQNLNLSPYAQFRQDCNAGAGGMVGQTYSGVVCGGSASTGGSGSNIASGQVTVATTPTLIAAARAGRRSITIQNGGTVITYLGGPTVTTTTGFPLIGTVGASVTLPYDGAIYGIVATGTEPVSYVEIY